MRNKCPIMDNDEEQPTVTGKWRVPISILVSAILITVGVCTSFFGLKGSFDRRMDSFSNDVKTLNADLKTGMAKNYEATMRMVTTEQFQHWREDAAELNPSVHWPRLPAKDAAYGLMLPKDMLAVKTAFKLTDLN